MSNSLQNPAFQSTEVGRIDLSLRTPGVLFILSGAFWLLFAGISGLLAYWQIVSPDMFESIPFLTFGRLKAVSVNALTHGWATNAGFALILWIMSRLSERSPDFDMRKYFVVPAGVVYNIMVTLGILAIIWGEARPYFLLEIPANILSALSISFVLITLWTILDYCRRKRYTAFISQYYIIGAVFWLAWIFSISQLIIGKNPLPGTIQMVAASWFSHAYIWLWLVPIACAVAYYLIPKALGFQIKNYFLAFFAFWCLAFFGPWGGSAELVGGPFPVWLQNISYASGVMLILIVICISTNLYLSCFHDSAKTRTGKEGEDTGSNINSVWDSSSGRFVVTGILVFPFFGLLTAFNALDVRNNDIHFTYWQDALFYLGVYGFYSMVILGGIYFMLPRLLGKEWKSTSLIKSNFTFTVTGFLVLCVGLFWGGMAQADALSNPEATPMDVSFITWMPVLFSTGGFFCLILGNGAFLLNVLRTVFSCSVESSASDECPTHIIGETEERSNV